MEAVVAIGRVISEGGWLLVLLLVLWALERGWWISGREYRALKQDRDEWRQLALTGTTAFEQAVSLATAERRRRSGDRGV